MGPERENELEVVPTAMDGDGLSFEHFRTGTVSLSTYSAPLQSWNAGDQHPPLNRWQAIFCFVFGQLGSP